MTGFLDVRFVETLAIPAADEISPDNRRLDTLADAAAIAPIASAGIFMVMFMAILLLCLCFCSFQRSPLARQNFVTHSKSPLKLYLKMSSKWTLALILLDTA